jgi:polyisoprenyl-teichoic acid--peptidoglycan teichoic acid transferase
MDSTSFETNHGWRILRSLLIVLLIAGALYAGFFFFSTVRAIVARTNIPFVENVVRTEAIQGESPIQKQDVPDVVVKKERITILLLGIDQREIETGPTRTDTMILVSIDPATNTAAMLSIPRDLWVTIPGYGENRINTAHFLGDANKYPGGGPALAKKTVWYDLGVPVHYYVRINFGAFEKLIDAIGGVTIDVKTAIHDTEYPDSNYGYMTVNIPAGVQHMDGKTALQYARSRHGNSDFDRMARQQAVILAARDKVLSLNIPLARIPELLATLGNSVKTDMSVDEMLALAQTAQQIDRGNIGHGVIDATMTSTVFTPQGWEVEVPDWEKIRKLVDELFPAPVSAALPTPMPTLLPSATPTRKG